MSGRSISMSGTHTVELRTGSQMNRLADHVAEWISGWVPNSTYGLPAAPAATNQSA